MLVITHLVLQHQYLLQMLVLLFLQIVDLQRLIYVRNANIYTLTNSNMKIKYAASNNTSQGKEEDQIAVHVVVWDFWSR